MTFPRWKFRTGLVVSSFVLAAFAPGGAPAQLSPFSNQLQVNTATAGYQTVPGAATDELGNVFVVWSSEGPLGTDLSGSSIRGRRFDSSDPTPWLEFQINSYTTGGQDQPAIAHLPTGGFVVVWESFGSDGGDTDSSSIQGQLLDVAGGNDGPQFQVNTVTTGFQKLPAVAADGLGNFVVVWQSSAGVGLPYSIVARRFDSAAVPDDDEFAVSTLTSTSQQFPSVAANAVGDFVVAWTATEPVDPDNSLSSIRARRFDANNAEPEFAVNSATTGAQSQPSVAMTPTGELLIAWQSEDHAGTDTDGFAIRARRFDNLDTPIGGDFGVNANTATAGNQTHPVALRDAKGDYVVVWESDTAPGDGDGSSLHGRRFHPDLSAFSRQTQLNSYTTGDVFAAAIAPMPDGGFVVAWSSYGSTGGDTSDSSIQARGYDSVFLDGFESNDLAQWTSWVP